MKLDLSLLDYTSHLTIRSTKQSSYVYDPIRKKEVILQPEELVRQCIIHFLGVKKKVSKNLIRVEKGIKVNGLYRRCDIIVYDRNAIPLLIVEVKRPNQKINQAVFDQITMYNIPLRVPFLMVSNGVESYLCKINFEKQSYEFLVDFPDYNKLIGKS